MELAAGTELSGGVLGQGEGAALDADGDGIPNAWEIRHGLDPRFSNAYADWDWDGFSDAEEYRLGSNLFDRSSRPAAAIEIRQKH